MKLPFTQDQFFNVFEQYNRDVWPMQIWFYLLAFTILFFLFKKKQFSNRIISAILAGFWMWMGLVYHLMYFSEINRAAFLFGSLFIIEGILLFFQGVIRNKFNFQFTTHSTFLIGVSLILYALLFYPFLGFSLGHYYPANPTFGLPCPTTIFTLGILLAAQGKHKWQLFVVPVLWSFIGGSASLLLQIYEDTGLLIAGGIVILLLILQRRQ